jgi:hypothetical protein
VVVQDVEAAAAVGDQPGHHPAVRDVLGLDQFAVLGDVAASPAAAAYV